MDFLIEEVGDLRGFLDWVSRIAVVHCDNIYTRVPRIISIRHEFFVRVLGTVCGYIQVL